jgi:hypothetical protein
MGLRSIWNDRQGLCCWNPIRLMAGLMALHVCRPACHDCSSALRWPAKYNDFPYNPTIWLLGSTGIICLHSHQ